MDHNPIVPNYYSQQTNLTKPVSFMSAVSYKTQIVAHVVFKALIMDCLHLCMFTVFSWKWGKSFASFSGSTATLTARRGLEQRSNGPLAEQSPGATCRSLETDTTKTRVLGRSPRFRGLWAYRSKPGLGKLPKGAPKKTFTKTFHSVGRAS